MGKVHREEHYAAYIIDPALEYDDKNPEQVSGLSLAQKIAHIEGKTDSVWMVSTNNSLLEQARGHRFIRLYHKSNDAPELYRSMEQFFLDLKDEMIKGRLADH